MCELLAAFDFLRTCYYRSLSFNSTTFLPCCWWIMSWHRFKVKLNAINQLPPPFLLHNMWHVEWQSAFQCLCWFPGQVFFFFFFLSEEYRSKNKCIVGGLTGVRLDGHRCGVRQVLEHFDLGEGKVSSEQRHHLDLHLVCGVGRHGHGHHPWTLPTHGPVTAAVSHCGGQRIRQWRHLRHLRAWNYSGYRPEDKN